MKIHVNEYYDDDSSDLETMVLESVSDVLGKNDPLLLAEVQKLYSDAKMDDSDEIELENLSERHSRYATVASADASTLIKLKVPLPGGYADLPDDEYDALIDGIYDAVSDAVESFKPKYAAPIKGLAYSIEDDADISDKGEVIIPVRADVEYRYEDESPELY